MCASSFKQQIGRRKNISEAQIVTLLSTTSCPEEFLFIPDCHPTDARNLQFADHQIFMQRKRNMQDVMINNRRNNLESLPFSSTPFFDNASQITCRFSSESKEPHTCTFLLLLAETADLFLYTKAFSTRFLLFTHLNSTALNNISGA